ncbi:MULTISPECIES: hypothetical protein [Haloarcula]|uniref:Uncharacterized protein n=1 Tax=Haloarcula pellucida TaxID=1427151 RepID=A0A830GGP9_9EURY|nr:MULTISPECIES: hypothetical protein [Halomicroarcula]MBX0347144.1 hypothetical protein [Halomicroarcula pellucida]MDS0276982.1 hypothetical protein [Halomicroarcula sp. S1AR25-4]GGN87208.1 hypothetical protein GCM10009030_05650 [Halomicroarcula pellucida]
MSETRPTFGALVLASLAGVVGTKYLLGGALAMVTESVGSSMLVADSIALTVGCGVMLGVVTGGFVDGAVWARFAAIAAFVVVSGLSVSAVLAADPIVLVETVGMGLAVAYLLVRNPIERLEEPDVESEDSASRFGSTLR